jgi:hypothetical protein
MIKPDETGAIAKVWVKKMGWKIINGRSYYYRTVREGGQIRSEYVGASGTASLIAQLDAIDREAKEAERHERKLERAQAETEDRELADWCESIETLARAALVAAGYHRHHRGEWRKRRERS